MKKIYITLVSAAVIGFAQGALITVGSAQGALITDDFNRADTALSSDLSASIGSGWTAGSSITEGQIASNAARVTVTESGSGMAVNTSLASLNEGRGTHFTVSADVTLDSAGGGVWGGVVVNYQDEDNFYALRYNGEGTVQFYRVWTGGGNSWSGGSFTHVPGRSYRVTVASDTPYIYDFSITDLTTDTVVFSAAGQNVGVSKHTNGYSGLYSNSNAATFDNYQLEVIPEPATIGLFVISSASILFWRRLRM